MYLALRSNEPIAGNNGWSSNRKSATGQFGVYARNDEQLRHIGTAQSPRCCMGLYQLAEIRWIGCGPHLEKQNYGRRLKCASCDVC